MQEVGCGTDLPHGLYFELCTSLHSLPNLGYFSALLKKKTREAKELSVIETCGKSCLTLYHGMHAQVENGDLPQLPLLGPWYCCSPQ